MLLEYHSHYDVAVMTNLIIIITTVPFERARAVDIQSESLFVEAHESFRVSWPQQLLLPTTDSINPGSLLVDVKLYEVISSTKAESTRELATLASNLPNTGEANITIPDLSSMVNATICPVGIQVEAKYTPTTIGKKRAVLPIRIVRWAVWAGKRYLRLQIKNRELCEKWSAKQPIGVGDDILERISREYPCPPTLNRVRVENSGFEEDFKPSQLVPTKFFDNAWKEFFHPGSIACYRQSSGFE